MLPWADVRDRDVASHTVAWRQNISYRSVRSGNVVLYGRVVCGRPQLNSACSIRHCGEERQQRHERPEQVRAENRCELGRHILPSSPHPRIRASSSTRGGPLAPPSRRSLARRMAFAGPEKTVSAVFRARRYPNTIGARSSAVASRSAAPRTSKDSCSS